MAASTDSIELIKSFVQDPCESYHFGCYCPKCEKYFSMSEYLESVFGGNHKALWLANLIMHYRHEHTNWDKNKYKLNGNKGVYDKDKAAVNEYIKQVLIKKYTHFLKLNNITKDNFASLKNTTNQTIKLAEERLCLKY